MNTRPAITTVALCIGAVMHVGIFFGGCTDDGEGKPYGSRPGGPAKPGSDAASAFPSEHKGPATANDPASGSSGGATHSSGAGTSAQPEQRQPAIPPTDPKTQPVD